MLGIPLLIAVAGVMVQGYNNVATRIDAQQAVEDREAYTASLLKRAVSADPIRPSVDGLYRIEDEILGSLIVTPAEFTALHTLDPSSEDYIGVLRSILDAQQGRAEAAA